MSASAYLKLKMTDQATISRMCSRCGFGVTFQNQTGRTVREGTTDAQIRWATIRIDPEATNDYRNQFRIDLSGQQDTYYDSDVRRQLFQKIMGRPMTAEELKPLPSKGFTNQTVGDEVIGEFLADAYEQAAVIGAAENEGLAWEEGKTDEGKTWIEVEMSDKGEEFEEAAYE